MAPVPKPRPQKPTFIRAWRVFRRLSQEQAAARLGLDGMNRSTLSRIENGKSPYDQAFLEAAAKAYTCEPADLLEIDPHSPEGRIIADIRALSPTKQDMLAAMIKGLKAA
jgi:transcriptional regulator with XRE-family HTH domain